MRDLLYTLDAVQRLMRWKFFAGKFDLDYRPKISNPIFKSAREAAILVPDNACIMGTGMTGTMRPGILYRAVRSRFEETGHPCNITSLTAGGSGGRGVAPGTIEELGLKGLTTRFISGHLETARALLDLADAGHCELGVLPQGTVTYLAEAQGRGEDSVLTEVGVGTFMDPRVGSGSQVVPGKGEQMVMAEGDKLRYRMPKVTTACVIATGADAEGNIYMKDAVIYAETREAARAARKNGGVALVTVARIVPKDEENIFLRADEVDAIVVNPKNEMMISIHQNKPWLWLTPSAKGNLSNITRRVQAFNKVLKMDPERGDVERMLSRQAAGIFADISHPGAHCIVGYGLPQEVGRQIELAGLGKNVTFLLETGVYGGVPAPGIFFGMAFNPERLISSAEMFHFCEDNLDTTILGTLQVDSEGNVNVSRKAPGVKNYIGPGGFMNLVTSAKNIIFVGAMNARSKIVIENGKVRLVEPGIHKYVEKVDEITFSAKEALRLGKRVFYVTPLCAFRLTEKGLELCQVAPGVDIEKDIIANSSARINLPEDGKVKVIDSAIVSGKGFALDWRN